MTPGNGQLPMPIDLDEETQKLVRLQNNPYVPDADKRHVSFTPRRKAVFINAIAEGASASLRDGAAAKHAEKDTCLENTTGRIYEEPELTQRVCSRSLGAGQDHLFRVALTRRRSTSYEGVAGGREPWQRRLGTRRRQRHGGT